MMVGVVFVYSPAIILESICGSKMWWIIAIFIYYIIATLLPIDKIIGKELGGHFFKIPQSVIGERLMMKQAANSKAELDALVG